MRTLNRAGRSRLAALLGFVALIITAAAARPRPTRALIITPATHDFGQVIVGAQGMVFAFKATMPPGAGPTDSIQRQYGGTDALDFRDGPQIGGSTPVPNACGDSIPRTTGTCYFLVEFVPHGLGPRSADIRVWDTRGNSGTAILTGTGIFGCTMYEGLCSYAGAYSGSVSWSSSLQMRMGAPSGPHHNGTRSTNVTVSVANGVATCQGTSQDDENDYEGTRLDRSRKATGTVSGPGIFTLEFKRQNGNWVYHLTVSCPSAQVTERYHDYISGDTSTTTLAAKPVNWRDRTSIEPEPTDSLGKTLLSGNRTFPHPDEDPLNGVTGTMIFTWSLRRP